MLLVSYPDTTLASITTTWYCFSCLACQPTGLLLPYLAYSSPLYTLFLLMDSTLSLFLLIYILFSDFWRSFQIPDDPFLQSACSSSQQDIVSKLRTNRVVSLSVLFTEYLHCSTVPCIRHGLCLTWRYYALSKRKNGEINILKCWSIFIWFPILSCMYFITLRFRGTWS